MDERYYAMINDEISMLESEPIFKDVSSLVMSNPELTLEELISELLKEEGLDKEEMRIRKSIASYLNSRLSSSTVLHLVDLSTIDIGKGTTGGYSYRNFNLGGYNANYLVDYKRVKALPLFQDAIATVPSNSGAVQRVKYKGIYIVVAKAEQGGGFGAEFTI